MCKLLAACAVAIALMGGSAGAADLKVQRRGATLAGVDYDWSGAFLGAHLGAGFSYRDWTLVGGATSEAGDAAMLGGQIGYNYQVGKTVVGVEADLSWGNLKDESLCPDGSN